MLCMNYHYARPSLIMQGILAKNTMTVFLKLPRRRTSQLQISCQMLAEKRFIYNGGIGHLIRRFTHSEDFLDPIRKVPLESNYFRSRKEDGSQQPKFERG